jgi:mannose-6-phosphate isomerase-like protein (cupin superfamily)
VHELRAGDAMVHRANAEAHTWIAGPEGIDLLIFGEGSRTRLTYLPRVQAWWLGPRWLPADGPNPFALEAAAGPLELPGASPRPATLRNLDELPVEAETHGRYAWHMRDLGRGTGSVSSGLRHDRIEEGQWTCPSHWHSAEEELFVVLDGQGEVELGTTRYPLRAGSLVACPPGTGSSTRSSPVPAA